jgi:hypothetical protein
MKTNIELIQLLQTILEVQHPIRAKLIKEFQDEVWNDESILDENMNEFLSELTYDLDFYEPNEQWRNEAPSYYGEERLEAEIKSAIQKLQEQSPK